MPQGLIGRKRGMMQLFDELGRSVSGTVVEIETNVITQIKTDENDGYSAIQLASEKVKVKDPRTLEKRVSKPLRGHFQKAKIEPRKFLKEFRVENVKDYSIGQEFGIETFSEGDFVDASALSKGKGFQGVMKLHNYAGGRDSHGSSKAHRIPGSIAPGRSTPGRCFPGGKRASRMGYDHVTVQNLQILKLHKDENVIVVKGAVPGPRNGIVILTNAKKKTEVKKK